MPNIAKWDDLIGNTPLVKLSNLSHEYGFNLFAKLEMFNLGGSMKDRPARHMIRMALRDGLIDSGTTVIESSSGNMGIGLAQICLHYGLRFICVVDANITPTNLSILKACGAQIEMINEPSGTASLLECRIRKVKELLQAIPNSFWPNQYANAYNAEAHFTTMQEAEEALQETFDFMLCATGTCGVIRGCSDYLKKHGRHTKIIGVDAFGSAIFSPKTNHKRLIPGHGAAVRPALYREAMANTVVHVNDVDCIVGCRRLLNQEALFAGGSSGAVIIAVEKLKHTIPKGANVLLILADRGERYIDTIYNDAWVKRHFGTQIKTKELLYDK